MNRKSYGAPHIVYPQNTTTIMRDLIIALMPALAWSVYIFGFRALGLTAFCVFCCIFFEWITARILNKPTTVTNLSAVVTGIILAFCLPAELPLYMAAIGCFVAIVIVKELFGGLGQNFANPAVTAALVLTLSFPEKMSSWMLTNRMSDVLINSAATYKTVMTPLELFQSANDLPSNLDLFLGFTTGTIGEISTVCLIAGGLFLVIRRIISPYATLPFLGTVAVMAVLMGYNPLFHLFAGGTMLGAIFMANDYVTTPITARGKIIFGIGAGVITMVIRGYGSYDDGVLFAILIMNILTPHIDTLTRNKTFKVTANEE